MPDDDWTEQMPKPDDYAFTSGIVDWDAWRKAAVSAIDDIVKREGETDEAPRP